MTYDKELAAAIAAAREAGLLCEDVGQELVGEALTKKDRSPVTVADFGAQALICRRLAREFPDDPVVGEEDASDLRPAEAAETREKVVRFCGAYAEGATEDDVLGWIDHGNGQVASRYWTLDPIDGTKGFLRRDQYAVALALIVEGKLEVGVLVCPRFPVAPDRADGELGTLFSAVRGQGAFARGLAGGEAVPIHVVAGTDLATFRMVESVESGHGDHALQEQVAQAVGLAPEPMRVDSQAKYGAVARGQAALYLRLPSPKTPDYREKIWDHAAGAAVVQEAGGRVTDVLGNELDFSSGHRMQGNRGVVVSNGAIHDRVLAELAGHF